ncbi:response regulator [Ponticaulis koreensis]|uniref:response regulator n=1 Tax=Ponticaulis koreensis TaxID=1123045 RepID=UPI0003B41DD7|nr:response regulator [Ponticaulis koreensis]
MCVPVSPPTGARHLLRVLIVDDSKYCRLTLHAMLEAWGIECITASDGEEGFLKVLKHQPDLIITDLQMPVCDGFGLIEKLTDINDRRIPPVIVLSSNLSHFEADKIELLKRARFSLLKPVNMACLLGCIQQAVPELLNVPRNQA